MSTGQDELNSSPFDVGVALVARCPNTGSELVRGHLELREGYVGFGGPEDSETEVFWSWSNGCWLMTSDEVPVSVDVLSATECISLEILREEWRAYHYPDLGVVHIDYPIALELGEFEGERVHQITKADGSQTMVLPGWLAINTMPRRGQQRPPTEARRQHD